MGPHATGPHVGSMGPLRRLSAAWGSDGSPRHGTPRGQHGTPTTSQCGLGLRWVPTPRDPTWAAWDPYDVSVRPGAPMGPHATGPHVGSMGPLRRLSAARGSDGSPRHGTPR